MFLYLLAASILLTLLWFAYSIWNDFCSKKEFQKRNVKYVKVANLFYAMISNVRVELVKENLIQREGNVFGFNMLGKRTILVAEPEIIQLVLSKEFANFVNHRVCR